MRIRLTKSRSIAAGLAAIAVVAAGVGSMSPLAAGDDSTSWSADWSMWQKTITGTRFNPAEYKINPSTVGNLKLKWAYTYPAIPFSRNGSQPAIVGGWLYVGAPDAKFLALDAKTGATKWTFDLTTATHGTTANPVRDGAAVAGD